MTTLEQLLDAERERDAATATMEAYWHANQPRLAWQLAKGRGTLRAEYIRLDNLEQAAIDKVMATMAAHYGWESKP